MAEDLEGEGGRDVLGVLGRVLRELLDGRGRGAPDPAGARTLPGDGGLKVPMGKAKSSSVQNGSLLYNEFIVYDVAQVKMKYVVVCELDFL